MDAGQVLFVILSIFGILALGRILWRYTRRWECVDGRCIPSREGSFNSRQECISNCIKPSSYVCDKDYNCIKVDGTSGQFSTQGDCNAGCIRPQQSPNYIVVNRPYYPQTLHYPYGPFIHRGFRPHRRR